jgi:hypothetical protein
MSNEIEHRYLPDSRLIMTLHGTIASPNKAVIASVYELNSAGPSPFTVRTRALTGWAAPNGVPLVLTEPDIPAETAAQAWEIARAAYARMFEALSLITPNNPLLERPTMPERSDKKSS